MAQTPKFYHHGKSPAAWTGVAFVALGSVLAAVGSVIGPNWFVTIAGGALVLVGGLVTMVMKAMGYGQP